MDSKTFGTALILSKILGGGRCPRADIVATFDYDDSMEWSWAATAKEKE